MDTPEQQSRGIARTVSAALAAAGVSQREAAARTGIPLTTLSRRLTGNSPFVVTELAALSVLLHTTVSALSAAAESQPAA